MSGLQVDSALEAELAKIQFSDTDEAAVVLQGYDTAELEHFVSISCERQRIAEYDKKMVVESYNDVISAEKDRRVAILEHLKIRREADYQVKNIAATAAAPAKV
jgi:hypothetical protein